MFDPYQNGTIRATLNGARLNSRLFDFSHFLTRSLHGDQQPDLQIVPNATVRLNLGNIRLSRAP